MLHPREQRTPSHNVLRGSAFRGAVAPLLLTAASRQPELVVYEPSLFGNAGPARLAWHVKVVSDNPAVVETTAYTAQLGYGWLSGTISGQDRAVGSNLTRDFNFTPLGTFQVTLPNGTYSVRLTVGDATAPHEQMAIFVEGVLKDTLSTAINQFLVKTYSVTVSDGQLTVLFDDTGGADANVVINAMEVL